MKRLIWIMLASALAVAIALAARYNTGSVRILFGQQQIDLSLNLFALLLLGGFIVFYVLLRVVSQVLQLPQTVRAYREKQSRKKARVAMVDALTSFFEGRFGHAEKAAASALKGNESTALLSVIAARSAHHLGDFAKRDEYLAKAEGRTPEASLLRQITQAELFLKERRIDDALDVLKRLRSEAPKNITAIKLELKAQTLAKNWDDVLTLSALLEKRKAILPQHAAQNRFNAQLGNLQRKAQEPDEIYAYWQQLASVDKQNATLASTAARLLISAGDHEHAKTMIEKSLDQRWDAGLVELYGNCIGAEPLRQVEWAEARLPQHQRDADLLLTLGKLCMQVKLWGKARSYIEASISIEPKRAAHAALAQLLAKTGNPEDAARHNRKFYSPGNE